MVNILGYEYDLSHPHLRLWYSNITSEMLPDLFEQINKLSKNLSFVNFGFLFMGYIEQLIYSSCNINTNTEKFNKKITKLVLTKYLNEFITGIKSNSKLNMFLHLCTFKTPIF